MTPLSMTPAIYQILLSLADGDRHGYGIMQEVSSRTADRVRLGPGTLYRSIKRLRGVGWIEAASGHPGGEDAEDDRRRVYRLTPSGRRELEEEARRLRRLVEDAADKDVLGSLGSS